MLTLIALCYCSIIWLIFFKFKLLPFNTLAKYIVSIIGVCGIMLLLIMMNIYQPYSTDLLVNQPVARVGARVSGRVVEVPVQVNTPLKKGEVLFQIDPEPYQIEVRRLQAALAEAEQAVPQLKAAVDAANAGLDKARSKQTQALRELERTSRLAKKGAASNRDVDSVKTELEARDANILEATAQQTQARLAYESEINGVNTTVAQLQAALAQANWNLKETTVRAPGDGIITQLGLTEGSIVGAVAMSHQLSFVYSEERIYIASFRQNALRHIRPGDPIEAAFDGMPGRIFEGKVDAVIPAMGQGQLAPGGDLLTRDRGLARGRAFVRITIDDDIFGESDKKPILGIGGAVAIYTQKAKAIRMIRKVMIRMYTWMNFLFTP